MGDEGEAVENATEGGPKGRPRVGEERFCFAGEAFGEGTDGGMIQVFLSERDPSGIVFFERAGGVRPQLGEVGDEIEELSNERRCNQEKEQAGTEEEASE